jgi:hypothetical protein
MISVLPPVIMMFRNPGESNTKVQTTFRISTQLDTGNEETREGEGAIQDDKINDEKDFGDVTECDPHAVLHGVAVRFDDEIGDNEDPTVIHQIYLHGMNQGRYAMRNIAQLRK